MKYYIRAVSYTHLDVYKRQKLDMAFMRNLDNENERNNIIVESIVELSKKLNIPVVVEGVESEKQVNFLKSIGAEVIQGYYFSKPIPTDEYEKLIEEQ